MTNLGFPVKKEQQKDIVLLLSHWKKTVFSLGVTALLAGCGSHPASGWYVHQDEPGKAEGLHLHFHTNGKLTGTAVEEETLAGKVVSHTSKAEGSWKRSLIALETSFIQGQGILSKKEISLHGKNYRLVSNADWGALVRGLSSQEPYAVRWQAESALARKLEQGSSLPVEIAKEQKHIQEELLADTVGLKKEKRERYYLLANTADGNPSVASSIMVVTPSSIRKESQAAQHWTMAEEAALRDRASAIASLSATWEGLCTRGVLNKKACVSKVKTRIAGLAREEDARGIEERLLILQKKWRAQFGQLEKLSEKESEAAQPMIPLATKIQAWNQKRRNFQKLLVAYVEFAENLFRHEDALLKTAGNHCTDMSYLHPLEMSATQNNSLIARLDANSSILQDTGKKLFQALSTFCQKERFAQAATLCSGVLPKLQKDSSTDFVSPVTESRLQGWEQSVSSSLLTTRTDWQNVCLRPHVPVAHPAIIGKSSPVPSKPKPITPHRVS